MVPQIQGLIWNQFLQKIYTRDLQIWNHKINYTKMFLLQSLLSEEMFKLSNIAQVQGETESDTEKNIPYGKEM